MRSCHLICTVPHYKHIISALVLILTMASVCGDLESNLVSSWHFDLNDSNQIDSFNDYDLTANGIVTYDITGFSGGSYLYDVGHGGNDYFFTDDGAFQLNESFTYNLWVKPTTSEPYFNYPIIIGNGGFYFQLVFTSGSEYRPYACLIGSGAYCTDDSAPSERVNANEWYMVTLVYDKSSELLTTYINGTLFVQSDVTGVGDLNYGSQNLKIGADSGFPYNGSIDETRVWARVLSDSEVLQLYNSYYGFVNEPPVVVAISPANDTQTGDSNLPVEFIVTDDHNATIFCTLYVADGLYYYNNFSVLNNTVSSFIPTWSKGSQHWEVVCADDDLDGSSGVYDLIFNSSLSVLVGAPANNTHSNVQDEISYEVYDTNHANDSCSLYIDGVYNATQNTLNDTVTTFTPTWTVGVHTFLVNCTDGLDVADGGLFNFVYDTSLPFINSGSPSILNNTIFTGYSMNITGNASDDNLWRINRTIRYPNGTIYLTNFSGNLPPLTTFYTWDDTFSTATIPNGVYSLQIEAADSHTAGYFAPALSVSEDVADKKLTYSLTYDTVEVALVGGDTKDSVMDVNTEKLPDRYTFEFEFDRPIEAGETSIFRVTSQYPIIYLPESPYKGHFILGQKYWMDFENYNGDVTVSRVDDYNYDVTITITDTKEYVVPGGESVLPPAKEDLIASSDVETDLTFFSLGGLNEAERVILFEVNNCIPDWVCAGYGSCGITDSAACNTTTDVNSCGLPYTGDLSEFSNQSCNYCSRSIVVLNQTACNGTNRDLCYNDTNWAVCCNITGLASDCFADTPQPAPEACQAESCSMFAYGSNDITGAATDLIVKGLIGLASVAFLVVFIYFGLWAYNKVKMR